MILKILWGEVNRAIGKASKQKEIEEDAENKLREIIDRRRDARNKPLDGRFEDRFGR